MDANQRHERRETARRRLIAQRESDPAFRKGRKLVFAALAVYVAASVISGVLGFFDEKWSAVFCVLMPVWALMSAWLVRCGVRGGMYAGLLLGVFWMSGSWHATDAVACAAVQVISMGLIGLHKSGKIYLAQMNEKQALRQALEE